MKYYAYEDLYDTTVRGCSDKEGGQLFSEAKKQAIGHMESTIIELKRQIKYVRNMRKKDITEVYNPNVF